MFKPRVQKSIDEIRTRLDVIEEEKASRKLRAIDRKVQMLNVKLSNLKTAIKVLLTVGALVIGVLGLLITYFGLKINDYKKFEAARPEVYKLLVSQLRQDTAEVVNKVFLAVVSDELKDKVKELKGKQESLAKLDYIDKDFKGTSGLIDAVGFLIQEQNQTKAKDKLNELLAHDDDKGFIRSRALAIKAFIDISREKHPKLTDLRKDLKDAIELDGTNALAFNCFGVLQAIEAEAILKQGKVNEDSLKSVTDLLTGARVEFQVAGGLDVSISGAYRRANNIIWNNLLLVKGYLDNERAESDILKHLNHTSLDIFFLESRVVLAEYIKLRPELRVAITTEVQLMCVEAQYLRRIKNDDEAAKKLTEKAAQRLIGAIQTGNLYQRMSEDAALENFNDKYLYREITHVNPEYAEQVRSTIMQVRP